jgi:hypothetical protein
MDVSGLERSSMVLNAARDQRPVGILLNAM